jgi:hypothetical protein
MAELITSIGSKDDNPIKSGNFRPTAYANFRFRLENRSSENPVMQA